jgi:hypothetical protein
MKKIIFLIYCFLTFLSGYTQKFPDYQVPTTIGGQNFIVAARRTGQRFYLKTIIANKEVKSARIGRKLNKQQVQDLYRTALLNVAYYSGCSQTGSFPEDILQFSESYSKGLVNAWFPDADVKVINVLPLNDNRQLKLIQMTDGKYKISFFQPANPSAKQPVPRSISILEYEVSRSQYEINTNNIDASDFVKNNLEKLARQIYAIPSANKPLLYLQESGSNYILGCSYDNVTVSPTNISISHATGQGMLGKPVQRLVRNVTGIVYPVRVGPVPIPPGSSPVSNQFLAN